MDVMEDLLKMKKAASEKQGTASVYSHLLYFHGEKQPLLFTPFVFSW
jgi:hypothetical protein